MWDRKKTRETLHLFIYLFSSCSTALIEEEVRTLCCPLALIVKLPFKLKINIVQLAS